MLKYYALFDLLNRRSMKRTDLLKVISSPTLAKLSKGQNVNTDIIDKICGFLSCQPGDIMEYYFGTLTDDNGVVYEGKPNADSDMVETHYVEGPSGIVNKIQYYENMKRLAESELAQYKETHLSNE